VHLTKRYFTCISFTLIFSQTVLAEDWPQFRGPTGQGHSAVRNLPLTWSDDSDNIAWKAPIDGLGWSSPVTVGDRIWITTSTDDGLVFLAICLDLKSGERIHSVEVFRREAALGIHGKNSHASPTPFLIDGKIYVHFGTYGTACLSQNGTVLWQTQIDYRHVHGPGGSPIVVDDFLIFSCDGGDKQFVIALDRNNGEECWRTERPENPTDKKFAFSTPLAIQVDNQTQIISAGAGSVVAYDPNFGTEIWHVKYPNGYSVVPRPVFANGLLFVSSSYDRPRLLAIHPGGNGDVTDSNVAWILQRGAPHNPSPLVVGDQVYVVSDGGIATCVDAKTGEQHWQERLGGNYSASPTYAANRIYFLDEQGTTTVIRPGIKYDELAKNSISGRTLASLTPTEGAMLLRTDTHLLRIDAE